MASGPLDAMIQSARTVILISNNPLFREGLVRVLREMEDFHLLGTADSIGAARHLLEQAEPDVIILAGDVEREQAAEGAGQLLDLTKEQLVELSLAGDEMVIYSRRQVEQATVEDLRDALASGN